MTYRQSVRAISETAVRQAAQRERDEREANRKLSLSASECAGEGFDRGIEDARDGYTGALDRIASRTLGDDYSYPESYRNGYVDGYYAEYESPPLLP